MGNRYSSKDEQVWMQKDDGSHIYISEAYSYRASDLFAEELNRLEDLKELLEQEIGNLLAVIHRDGGHYITQHGLSKAITDAISIIYTLRESLPTTADSVTVDPGKPVWFRDIEGDLRSDGLDAYGVTYFKHGESYFIPISQCYSIRLLAEESFNG